MYREMNVELIELSNKVDDLIKAASDKEADMMTRNDFDAYELLVLSAKKTAYFEIKSLIIELS